MTQSTTLAGADRLTIVRLPEPPDAETFAEAVRAGLSARPKTPPLPSTSTTRPGRSSSRAICELPEYYLTRTEDAILREHADAMVAGWTRSPALIELGSGSSSKTRRLIAAALGAYGDAALRPDRRLADDPGGVGPGPGPRLPRPPRDRLRGQLPDGLARLASAHPAARGCCVFLGSSLGNYDADDAVGLLGQVARGHGPGTTASCSGPTWPRTAATLEAAYDDAQGVTAEFNRNLLVRINRELGADFDLDQFAHRAEYRPDRERVEMHLVSRADQVVRIPGADLTVRFAEGESIHTENSHKYTLDDLRTLAERSGFVEEAAWTDPRGLLPRAAVATRDELKRNRERGSSESCSRLGSVLPLLSRSGYSTSSWARRMPENCQRASGGRSCGRSAGCARAAWRTSRRAAPTGCT